MGSLVVENSEADQNVRVEGVKCGMCWWWLGVWVRRDKGILESCWGEDWGMSFVQRMWAMGMPFWLDVPMQTPWMSEGMSLVWKFFWLLDGSIHCEHWQASRRKMLSKVVVCLSFRGIDILEL